jgi:hypothetical protein
MTDITVVDPKITPPAAPAPPVPPAAPSPAAALAPPAAASVPPASAPAATTEPAKPVNPNSPKWALDRISEEARRARAAEEELARERAGRQSAEELLRRLQSGAPNANATAAPPNPQQQSPSGRQAEIAAEAARQRFLEDINDTVAKGLSQFGHDSFTGTVNTLTAIGANDEFLADVLAVDKANAHQLFQKIAAEPERAATLARMPSRQRIAEIARMTVAQGNAAPANGSNAAPTTPAASATVVSKAPAPPPPIQAGASQVQEKHWWDENLDGTELDRIFFDPKRLEQRAGRARR